MPSPIPFSLRPYHSADAAQVVEVVNAEASQTIGFKRAVLDQFGQVRLSRYVPSSAKVVAVTPQNQIIGFAYLANREQYLVYEIGGAVHPEVWGQGVGRQLLKWGEQQASALSQFAPLGVKTVLQANLFEDEQSARQLYAHTGYTQTREWLHLSLDLTPAVPSPVIPNGMTLRAIDLDNDWDSLGPALDEAFADHWGVVADPLPETPPPPATPAPETPPDASYSNAPGFCFMLLNGAEVAGGILCNAKLVERPDTGRVGSVFVRRPYRRHGVRRALMLTAFQAFEQAGLRRIVLDTDAHSFSQSPKFYGQLGMQVYRRELLYEKDIRAGREVRRLEA